MASEVDALGHLRGEELGHGGFFHEVHSRIFHAGGVVDHEPGGFDLGGHLRNLELDALEIGERLAELFALLRVFGGELPGAARDADHLRADADAAFVQSFDRDLVAFAGLAEHVFFGHAAIFENQFAGG